jgi:hypothetical protein
LKPRFQCQFATQTDEKMSFQSGNETRWIYRWTSGPDHQHHGNHQRQLCQLRKQTTGAS